MFSNNNFEVDNKALFDKEVDILFANYIPFRNKDELSAAVGKLRGGNSSQKQMPKPLQKKLRDTINEVIKLKAKYGIVNDKVLSSTNPRSIQPNAAIPSQKKKTGAKAAVLDCGGGEQVDAKFLAAYKATDFVEAQRIAIEQRKLARIEAEKKKAEEEAKAKKEAEAELALKNQIIINTNLQPSPPTQHPQNYYNIWTGHVFTPPSIAITPPIIHNRIDFDLEALDEEEGKVQTIIEEVADVDTPPPAYVGSVSSEEVAAETPPTTVTVDPFEEIVKLAQFNESDHMKYLNLLQQDIIYIEVLLEATDEELKSMGFDKFGPRHKIKKGIALFKKKYLQKGESV
jgi:hypothetical protein